MSFPVEACKEWWFLALLADTISMEIHLLINFLSAGDINVCHLGTVSVVSKTVHIFVNGYTGFNHIQ